MQHSRFIAGALVGAVAVAAVGGGVTYVFAGKDVQHSTIHPVARALYVKVDGHLAVHRTTLQSRIEGWYHPLPWLGRDVHDVSCPRHLKAVAGASETCTAQADGTRISIPVHVVKVEGKASEPKVTWKFDR
ncbi:DUF4333 domain-containing protein [Streptomyces sp. NPDC096046]|uniref:DUF4333 domain-containing protein n=1 Tax=Streptomyces sp. NPDC096046 TaxID=3155542 RepID=UPI00332C0238